MDSTDSLALELKKSKSLGHLRAAASVAVDVQSVGSRSSASTPASDFPPTSNDIARLEEAGGDNLSTTR